MQFSTQQQAFLDWAQHGRGSCVLEAVAGAGKTTTVLAAAELIQGGCAIMAYNTKIAEEIKAKLKKNGVDYRKAEAGTVHSFGFRAYRKAFPDVVVVERKLELIMEQVATEKANDYQFLSKLESLQPKLIKLVGLAKQAAVGVLTSLRERGQWEHLIEHFAVMGDSDEPVQDLDGQKEWLVRAGMGLLQRSNAQSLVIDFDDMVYMPLVHRVRFWKYDAVFVDEAQDTNAARRAIVRAMVKPGGRVVAVGDPHQAIYGFTGADSDSLDLIAQDFNATRMPLTITYRCPKAVVQFARQWVGHITAGDTAPEGEVCEMSFAEMVQRSDLDGNSAILCRNVAPLVSSAFKLIRNRVACKIEGREVGAGLVKLATRWKAVKTVNGLETKLADYQERQTDRLLAKKQESAAQAIVDQCDTLRVIIERVREDKRDQVTDVVAYIQDLFSDKVEGILTLSTIHKSKGREWHRVYWLDRAGTCPSRYARQPWQMQQEDNLCYVAATRAMNTLIELKP